MSLANVLAGASEAGLTAFEKERAARIAANKKRLDECMQGSDISLLLLPPSKPRTPSQPRKRKEPSQGDAEIRRSSRIGNLPTPLYCIEEDATDRSTPRSRSQLGPGGRGVNGRRCHGAGGLAAAAVDPYLAHPAGWKVECGSASLAAAERATDAALELQRELVQQSRPAYVKLMSASQVSGGFWMQLPLDMVPAYGLNKRTITLHCDDKADADPEEFANPLRSSTRWPVVYLPKSDSGAGLSGGWRGFAIDQRIHPNDTVMFEVMDGEVTAAGAGDGGGAGCGSSAAGSVNEEGGSSSSAASGAAAAVRVVQPHQRLHMRAHIFRAANFEPNSLAANVKQQLLLSRPQPAAAGNGQAAGLAAAAVGSDSQDGQPLLLTKYSSMESCDAAAAAGNAADNSGSSEAEQQDDEDMLVDIPLSQRVGVAAAAAVEGLGTPGAAPFKSTQAPGSSSLSGLRLSRQLSGLSQPLSPEQQVVQRLGLMEAAEKGMLRVKVARQISSSTKSGSKGGSKGGSCSPCIQPRSTSKPATEAKQQQQQAKSGSGKSAKGKNKSSSNAAAAAAEEQPRKRRAAAEAANMAWAFARGGSAAAAAAGSRGVQLVPQPADPSKLVPGPTAEEKARDAAGGPYWVQSIMGHRVNPDSLADEFLIRWWHFGPYFDSWEARDCLDNEPGTYPWKGGATAIPPKFRG